MLGWLKFFNLSFFSESIAEECKTRSFSNIFLSFIMSIVFCFLGMFGAEMIPFKSNYNRAEEFKEFLYTTFATTDGSARIELTLSEKTLSATKNGAPVLVNTYANSADKDAYGANGYELVVDTRPSNTLAVFEMSYVKKNDVSATISHDEYYSLSAEDKKDYVVKPNYSNEEYVLTSTITAEQEAFLDGACVEGAQFYNKKIADKYSDLKQNKDTTEDYALQVYYLYFAAYYPEMYTENLNVVPHVRDFYTEEYMAMNTSSKCLYLFNDSFVGSYENKRGTAFSFYGYYGKLADMQITSATMSKAQARANLDEFIVDAFNATSNVTAIVCFMNISRLFIYYVIIWMVVTLICTFVMRKIKSKTYRNFSDSMRLTGAFLMGSALLTAICNVIGGFFVSMNAIVINSMLLLFVTLSMRTAISIINERNRVLEKEAESKSEVEEYLSEGETLPANFAENGGYTETLPTTFAGEDTSETEDDSSKENQ